MGQNCLKSRDVPSNIGFEESKNKLDNLGLDCQYRDRSVIIDLPSMQNSDRQSQIQSWLTQTFNQIFSIAFFSLQQKRLTYNQTKLFACSNVLKNIINLQQSQGLKMHQVKMFNQFATKKMLPYLKAKYPMSSQSEVNKKLLNKIKQIDNLDDSQNDYIDKSKVQFQYRQNGNYNDLIMRFMNEIIQFPQRLAEKEQKQQKLQKNTSQNKSYYFQFKTAMTQLFQSCSDYDQVYKNDKKSIEKMSSEQKDAYQIQVKNYTHFLIGRKLTENTEPFSEEEIQNKDFNIKSAGLLRILTKWAQQLWAKFKNPMSVVERVQPFRYLDKRPGFAMNRKHRLHLVHLLQEQKKRVHQQMQEINEQIYKFQFLVLQETKNRYANFIPDLQFKEGYFADNCVRALQTFIVKYINIIIHGLMKVSKKFHQENSRIMSAPYQLLTFKIGDVIRCKCHSKEKQILFLYDQIMQYDPKIIKVIRVKNRLASGTQDILINIKFCNEMIGEIQLAIDSKKNQHIENSTKFNHFIYELQRAQFGPLMELSSVWSFYNQRYDKIHQAVVQSKRKMVGKIKGEKICLLSHSLEIQINPFLCRQCCTFFVKDFCIIQNQKCSKCEYRICSLCRIKSLQDQDLKKLIFKNQNLRNNCKRFYGFDIKDLPQTGIVFNKKSKNKKLTCYKIFTDETQNKVFIRKRRDEDFKILILNNKNLDDYLIWQNQISLTYYQGITYQNQIKKSCILPKIFKDLQKKHKINLYMEENNLTDAEFQNLINKNWKDNYKNSIKTANLAQNLMKSMKNILTHLPNLQSLVLSQNPVYQIVIPDFATNLTKLSLTKIKFPGKKQFVLDSYSVYSHIKYMNLGWNKLESLPQQIGKFTGLQQLSVQENNLTDLPSSIIKLKQLKILALNGNSFQKLQNQIFQLLNLQQLQVKNNKLIGISQKVKYLKKLKKLRVDQNKLLELPQSIGELKQLTQISAAKNQIQKIQSSILKLKKLQLLILNNNKIQKIEDIQQLQSLQKLVLGANLIKLIFPISKLQKLKVLQLQQNQIRSLSEDFYLSGSLQELNLSQNKIQSLGANIKHLKSLKKMDLSSNALYMVPPQISNMNSLQWLILSGNQSLQTIPDAFSHFLKLIKLQISPKYLSDLSLKIIQDLQAKGLKIQRKQ